MFNSSIFGRIAFYMCFSLFSYTQAQTHFKIPDSLKARSFEELEATIKGSNYNYSISEIYTKSYIQKAKNKNDSVHLAKGYHYMAAIEKEVNKKLIYIDSSIFISEHWKNLNYPEQAYIYKGVIYHRNNDLKKALDSYLLADQYARKKGNTKIVNQVQSNIGLLLSLTGEYDEALKYFKKYYGYLNSKDKYHPFSSNSILNHLANTYRYLNELDSASFFNKKGYFQAKSKKNEKAQDGIIYDEEFWIHQFIVNEGVVEYHRKNYQNAIDSIKKVLPFYIEKNNELTLPGLYSYLGKSYYKKNNIDSAINYLKKSALIFEEKQIVIPGTKDGYEMLRDYYKNRKDHKNHFKYIELLIKFDSIQQNDYKYLTKNIYTKYELNKLNQEKERVLSDLEKSSIKNLWLTLLFVLAVTLSIYFFVKQHIYKLRFKKFIQEYNSNSPHIKKQANDQPGVPKDIIKKIKQGLNNFEEKQEFTNPNLTLGSLAKKLSTNSKYLSIVLNSNENKSFRVYINNLRIQYVINRLQKEKMFKKYAIKAIASESGFNNPETFAKAFYKYTGVYPSFFIKQLEK